MHLDSIHLGGIAQTIVHEALHHISYYKASPGYRLTATERKALRDIERIRQFAERAAIAKRMLPGENVTEARKRLKSAGDRRLYGLTDVDEFITEILTNPSFQAFLAELKPMQGIKKKGGLIRNLLDQVFAYLKDFIFGMDVSGDSLLTQGLDNVMSLIQTPQDPRKVREVAAAIDWNLASRATMPADNDPLGLLNKSEDSLSNLQLGKYQPDTLPYGIYKMAVPGSTRLHGDQLKRLIGGNLEAASEIARRSHQASSISAREPKTKDQRAALLRGIKAKEAEALRQWAKENGLWIDGQKWAAKWKSAASGTEGAEHAAFEEGGFWEKANDLSYHSDWLSYFDRLKAHNILFPETAYEVVGFTDLPSDADGQLIGGEGHSGGFQVVVRQKDVQHSGASVKASEVEARMEAMGFKPSGRPNDYVSSDGHLFIEDLHEENVLRVVDSNGVSRIAVVDPVIFTNPDTKLRRFAELANEARKAAAPMSPAGDAKKIAKLTGAETKTTFTGGTYEKGGLLSTDGNLDKRAGDLWRKRNMQVGAQERMVNIAVNKLVNAVKAARKAGQEPPTNLMNTALGNLDNPLTQAQRSEIKRLREIDEEAANAQEGAYMAKNREAFKVKQAEALRQLPTEIAEAIQEMTEHITALSGALKKAGILEPGLAATIDANLGIYLHRSYEIFDNPAFKDKIKKDEMVMKAAENLLRRQIESRNAQKLIDEVAKEGGILSKADAERQARGTAKREEIDRVMEQLLAVGEESLGGVILRGRIPGQKDLSILDARGNIAPEIQALWGRYEDPTINYAKTVMKISALVANHQFLAETRALGLQEGWLYEGEDHPPGYLKIASENNKSLAPLSGLYGNRDLVEALYAMYPPAGIAENYEWVKLFAKLTGMSMASKTVLSAASHVRNFAGNFLNLAASGNLGINDILNGGRYKKALDLTIRSTFSNASAQQFKDTIKELPAGADAPAEWGGYTLCFPCPRWLIHSGGFGIKASKAGPISVTGGGNKTAGF